MRWRVSDLWSGGAYGPEASVLTCGMIVALIWVLYRAPSSRPKLEEVSDVPPCPSLPGFLRSLLRCSPTSSRRTSALRFCAACCPSMPPRRRTSSEIEEAAASSRALASSTKTNGRKSGKQLGPAARPGDLVQVTKVDIDDDKIVLEINGGAKGKRKWYQNVEVGMGNSTTPINSQQNTAAPGGTTIALAVRQARAARCRRRS